MTQQTPHEQVEREHPPETGGHRRSQRNLGATTKYRVAHLGPVGVGKTTAVRALSDVATVGTDVAISAPELAEAGSPTKTTTTVGIDYGVWKPAPGLNVALVGTPGQERFGAVRSALMAPHTRAVLWLFGSRPDLANQARPWIELLNDAGMLPRAVVALTRTTDITGGTRVVHGLVDAVGGVRPPIVRADPRDRDSVARVVSRVLDLSEAPS